MHACVTFSCFRRMLPYPATTIFIWNLQYSSSLEHTLIGQWIEGLHVIKLEVGYENGLCCVRLNACA